MESTEIVALVIAIIISLGLLVSLGYYLISADDFDGVDNLERNYISRDIKECKTIQVLCIEGLKRFDDNTGCGCEPVVDAKHFCTPEQRNADACIEIYQPVCGFSSSDENIKTFSNSCFACIDENVAYWTEGECPSP